VRGPQDPQFHHPTTKQSFTSQGVAEMGVEFELKFSAEPEQLAAVAAAYPVQYGTISMETTYFDTADFALSDRHITLRRRLENGTSVCTVKTPISELGRGEWECHCDDIETSIATLCKLGAPKELIALTVCGVAPVCGAKFTRQAGVVTVQDTVVEIALDQGILFAGQREIPLCEVEVELKSGNQNEAVAFAMALAECFGLKTQKKSKFRRALALAKGE
jgi:triphosphatase